MSEGACTGGDVVRCAWDGGHTWLFGSARANGGLVTSFLLRWAKPSHRGGGHSRRGPPSPNATASRLTLIDVAAEPPPRAAATATAARRHHYGDPARGCLADEDKVPAGTGATCAPIIGAIPPADRTAPPLPLCHVGGVARDPNNGCPPRSDADPSDAHAAWPVCLAKRADGGEDPYASGHFHCLLVCPCAAGGVGSECGEQAHDHCPHGARCERGELRHVASGVCTYRTRLARGSTGGDAESETNTAAHSA